jgi:integral membrane protein (TIGR00529 family)
LGFVDPLTALVVSFAFLGVMVYKRVNLGVTLTSTAILLSLLSMEFGGIPNVFLETSTDALTISLVSATFGIMLLSQLYKETGVVNNMSRNLSDIVKNSKLVVSLLPAVIGLLPVAGGALMSAPLIEAEANKLELKEDKKTYVNIWFRHTIFPVYPMSQVLILTVALTSISLTSLIMRQIPVAIAMVAVGYLIAFWKVSTVKDEVEKSNFNGNLLSLLTSFSPIIAMIFAVAVLGIDVSIAAFIGVAVLLLIARPSLNTFSMPFRNKAIYGVTLAAYGAMLLRKVTIESGVSDVLGEIIANGNVNEVVLLLTVPAVLGFLVGSPSGGIAISVPMLAGTLSFMPNAAGLLYISAYLGYLGAPTHLCLVLTADYFKCPLGRLYKYMIPSLVISFIAAILVYFLI